MPLFAEYFESDYQLVLWKMDEDEAFFREKINLTEKETEYLYRITNSNRRKEWLAIRYLLQNKFNLQQCISYTAEGKPFIDSYHLGISHSFEIAGLILSKYPCALDVEKVLPRIVNIAHRAFSPQELHFAQTPEQLTVCWCAKETIFKLYGHGNIDFKGDIEISTIKNFTDGEIGVFFQLEKRYFGKIKLKTIDDYKVTWIVIPPTE